MTNGAGDRVHNEIPDPADEAELVIYLQAYAERQLAIVMTPRLLQLRRLVIGEVSRFPALATALSESGLQRAISALATVFERQADRGLLEIGDPFLAASQFNWLIMSAPLNDAMLLGDTAISNSAKLHRHAVESMRLFLAA